MSQDASRWMAVGRATGPDAAQVGEQATRKAQQGSDPRLLVVFAADSYDPAALLAGVRSAAPDVPVVGCSTRGEITPDGPADGTVVVTAMGGEGLVVSTAWAEDAADRQCEAGAEVARCADDVPDLEYKILLLLTDGYTRQQEDIVRGAYGVVGASVPLVGGGAAAHAPDSAYQLCGDRVLRGGAVAATIASPAPISIGVSHGWHKVGGAMVVTRSDQGRVYTLDNEPALDKYLRQLDAPPEVYHDPDEFSRWTLTRPLGVQRRSGVAAWRRGGQEHQPRRGLHRPVHRWRHRDRAGRAAVGHPGQRRIHPRRRRRGLPVRPRRAGRPPADRDAGVQLHGLPGGPRRRRDPGGELTHRGAGRRRSVRRLPHPRRDRPYRGVEGFHNQTLVVLALS